MAQNRGKQFEDVIRESFEKVPGVSIDRLHDQTTHYKGSTNICDFIVYREPYEYYFECKSIHGNTLSIHSNDTKRKYGSISNAQWEGLLEKSRIDGVTAGVICWFIDKDVTLFIPIQRLQICKDNGWKSINYAKALTVADCTEVNGKKKRVFFEYDMEEFLNDINRCSTGGI